MKLIQINTVCNGSTGRIMGDIQRAAIREGFETCSIYGRRRGYSDLPCRKFGGFFSFWTHVAVNTLFDLQGSASYIKTKKIVRFLRLEKPDIIHLHNLHGYYINIKILFDYLINEYTGRVVWTFHDCWPITGHCAHFVSAGCNRWQKYCHNCPKKTVYPISLGLDMSSRNYREKRRLFTSLNNLSIICPSEWMAEVVRESFLSDKDIRVVHNGIDTNIFKPSNRLSEINGIKLDDKHLILCVAQIWDRSKGLDAIIDIAKNISDDYLIILVGKISGRIKGMPDKLVHVGRIDDKEKLVRLYSSADVFVNPSKEESFSLVTLEAIACGTSAVVLDTSAVVELINDRNGIILHDPSTSDYIEAIKNVKKDVKEVAKTASEYTIDKMTEEVIEMYR